MVTGLPRANVYGALRNLEAKGAIQPVTERPVRYVPVDPEQFFRRLQRNTAGLCDDVVRAVKRSARPEENAYVCLYRGAAEVHDKVIELIDAAREHIWIKAPAALIEPYRAALVKAAQSPDVVESWRKIGVEPFIQPSPQAFRTFMQRETDSWGKIAKASGATAD